jgi:hypothetical protein
LPGDVSAGLGGDVVLVEDEVERDRVKGLARDRIGQLASEVGLVMALDGLPEHRPGCASRIGIR